MQSLIQGRSEARFIKYPVLLGQQHLALPCLAHLWSLLNDGNSLSSGPLVLCRASSSLVSTLPLESPFLKLQIWWGQSPSGAPNWTPTKRETCYCWSGGSSHSGPRLSPASSPSCPTLSSGSTNTDYRLSAHAAPSARSTFPSCLGLTISSSLSRLSLEISASEKLSLGSLSSQVPLVSGPMEPCTSPSCWIIIACLPVCSAKLRSPWQLGLCLSGSWLYLVLRMLSSWEVLKMYLLNEWVNEVKIFFPILWYSYFLSLYPLFPHYYNYNFFFFELTIIRAS